MLLSWLVVLRVSGFSMSKVRERVERLKAIRRLAKNGLSAQEIADQLGLSATTIYNDSRGDGLKLETSTKARRREIAEFCKTSKLPLTEIAKLVKASAPMIIRACAEYGVPVPSKLSSASKQSFDILAELMAGWSVSEVSENFTITPQRVSQIKSKAEQAKILGKQSRFKKFEER